MAFELVLMNGVLNVQNGFEFIIDYLRFFHLAGHPLEEWRWGSVEIPFDVELHFFSFVVIEIAVEQYVSSAGLDFFGHGQVENLD